ncbi:MAG: succinyldiaminopimelate transaminase [Gammaproteobacteria bacterium]|nr:succinyldiaminopimelate transaminase [Gammaproteobacteria bacterium]
MNSRLARLQPYPFQKLAALLQGIVPPKDKPVIRLSIGEPQHAAPAFVLEALTQNLGGLANYPATKGATELRRAIVDWANHRFQLQRSPLDTERHVLPVGGTREALFAIAQTVVDAHATSPVVVMPNPFYQIYEGAALLAGAEPYLLNTVEENGYRMDFASVPEAVWQRTQLVYVCSPGNPTGAVVSAIDFARLIDYSQRYNFVIASDECYSEIFFDEAEPPTGLLQVAHELGITDYKNCLVFNSLSKRSNLPGLRSGFVAGDPQIIEQFFQYRTYHGCALPPPTQAASAVAWADEAHVRQNRALYRAKFDAMLAVLGPIVSVRRPDAGFFLWPKTPVDDQRFTRELYAKQGVVVLPGSYLSRPSASGDPGSARVRMALVASLDECTDAAKRIRNYVESI